MAETYLDIFNFILIIGVIQGFLFNAITFFSNRVKDKSILFLSLTVLFLSINNLQSWLIDKNLEFSYYYLKYLKLPWNIFLAPLFYLFLVKYLRIEKRLKNILLSVTIFFIVILITRLFLLKHLTPYLEKPYFVYTLRRYNSLEDIIIFIITMLIFLYSGILFFKRKNRFELISTFDNLKWIKTFFFLSSAVLLLWLVALFLNFYYIDISTSYFYSPLRLGTSFLIYWIGYQGLYQQKFVNDRMGIRNKLDNHIITKNSITKTNSKQNNIENSESSKQQTQFQQINDYIVSEKKFTDTTFNLESLAEELNIGLTSLSILINKGSNSNFTDYINKFRVEQAKEFLVDKDYIDYTILSIGLESGFNSKSTFYKSFKRYTGLTPFSYKKKFKEY